MLKKTTNQTTETLIVFQSVSENMIPCNHNWKTQNAFTHIWFNLMCIWSSRVKGKWHFCELSVSAAAVGADVCEGIEAACPHFQRPVLFIVSVDTKVMDGASQDGRGPTQVVSTGERTMEKKNQSSVADLACRIIQFILQKQYYKHFNLCCSKHNGRLLPTMMHL